MAGSDRASCAAGLCACLSALATIIVAALLLVVVIGSERAPLAERLTRGDAVAMQVAGAVSCGLCMLCSGVVAGQARRDAVQLERHAGTSSTRPPLHAERAAGAGRLDAKAKDDRALELHAGTPTRPPLYAERAADAFSEDERAAAIQIQSAWRRWAGAKFYRHWRRHYAGEPPSGDVYIVWKAMHAAKRALRI